MRGLESLGGVLQALKSESFVHSAPPATNLVFYIFLQVLRSIVKDCLNKCNLSGKSSIAFPAIGTGVLGFPHNVAAKILFEETKEFEKRISNCNVKEVSFVVYNQDAKSIEAFMNELEKQTEWGLDVNVPVVLPRNQRNSKLHSTSKENDSSIASKSSPEKEGNNVMCIQVQKTDKEIEIVKGDITKEATDMIAHLTNPGLSLKGAVAMALRSIGGQDIERECQRLAESTELNIATTALTTAGQLDAKYIAHMVASNNPSLNEIEKCLSDCLKTASEKECESISFPAVGTGSLKHDPQKAAMTILTSVIHFLKSSHGSLKLVRIVVKNDDLATEFQHSVKKLIEDEEGGRWKRLLNLFWRFDSTTISVKEKPPVIKTKIILEIYAKDEVTFNRAKNKIAKKLESQNKSDNIYDDNVRKLSTRHITEIELLCEMNDVNFAIEKNDNRIVVSGHSDDLTNTIAKIYKILKRFGEEEKEKEKAAWHADLAEIVSQGVQWFCVDPTSGDHDEYNKHINAIIEKAYSKREKSVIFALGDIRCEIVFDKMQGTNLDTNETKTIIRKDLKGM